MNLLDSSCTSCPTGTYSEVNGATGSCNLCPAGTSSTDYGSSSSASCKTCPAGTYSNEGATACTPCPAGSYSLEGANTCDICQAGTYSLEGASSCSACPAGQNSFPGFSSCFASQIFDGQRFAIQSLFTKLNLTADIPDPVEPGPLIQASEGFSPNAFFTPANIYLDLFTYDSTTMQIYNPSTGLCLDDLGHGYSTDSSVSDTLEFTTCSSSKTQQFAYFPSTKYLLNPNNPYDKCLDSNYKYLFPDIFLWPCPYGDLNHQWDVILSCMPGIIDFRSCLKLIVYSRILSSKPI